MSDVQTLSHDVHTGVDRQSAEVEESHFCQLAAHTTVENKLMCISEIKTWMPEAGTLHPETNHRVQTNFSKKNRAAFPLCQRQRCKGAFLYKYPKIKPNKNFLKPTICTFAPFCFCNVDRRKCRTATFVSKSFKCKTRTFIRQKSVNIFCDSVGQYPNSNIATGAPVYPP